jgi:EmrB/QacA subfamily drug resistance transporter
MSIAAPERVHVDGPPYRRRWWVLGVLCLSLLVVVMANTTLVVAAPELTRDLGLSSDQLQWVIDGYTVPYAALMLLFGVLGDRFGRRKALVAGLIIFGAGSMAGSVAASMTEVMLARVTMGVGAAIIMPATLSLLVAIFPKGERAKAISIWAATSGLGIAVGPLVAGLLLQGSGWNSTFLINVPVVVLAVAASLAIVPPSRVKSPKAIDWVGGLLSVITIGTLVYAIIDGFHSGWGPLSLTCAAVASVGIGAFIVWELRHQNPLLNVRALKDRKVGGCTLVVTLLFFAAFGAVFYVSQYYQSVLGYGPFETGLGLVPLAIAVTVGSLLSSKLMPRLGGRWLITGGMIAAAAAMLLLTQVDGHSSNTIFLIALALLGLGIGLSEPPATDAIMGGFGDDELGAAGGLNDTAIELGGSLGIALLGSVLATTYSSDARPAMETLDLTSLPQQAQTQATALLGSAGDSVGAATVVAEHLGQEQLTMPLATAVTNAAGDAFAAAVQSASWVAGVVLLVGGVAAATMLPNRRSWDRS